MPYTVLVGLLINFPLENLRSISMKTSSFLSAACNERDHVIRFWAMFGANCKERDPFWLTDAADHSISVTKEDVILPFNAWQQCECYRSL